MKKLTRLPFSIFHLFALTLLIGCTSKPSAKVDVNPNINFNKLTSFQFTPYTADTVDSNPIMINRIQRAVESQLIATGLQKVNFVDNQSADLTISVNFSMQEKPNNSSFNIGIGTGRITGKSSTNIGINTKIPFNSKPSIVTKIIIDMKNQNQAAWHGTDSYQTSEDSPIEEIDRAVLNTVKRLLANFPPNKVKDKNNK